jgi:hypothetical protein
LLQYVNEARAREYRYQASSPDDLVEDGSQAFNIERTIIERTTIEGSLATASRVSFPFRRSGRLTPKKLAEAPAPRRPALFRSGAERRRAPAARPFGAEPFCATCRGGAPRRRWALNEHQRG